MIVTAHRGASDIAPENTLIAVKKAIDLGADYAEIDVWQTQDDEIILMHDKTPRRTTNAKGKKEIWNYSLEELKKLDAGSWFGKEFKNEPVPTLLEAIQVIKGKIKLNIELKISFEEPGMVQKIVDIIRTEGLGKDCMVTSFDRRSVEEVKNIAPEIKAGFIFEKGYPVDVYDGNWEVLSCSRKVVDEELVERARKSNKEIHVWTVNNVKEMKRLMNLGIDGIITGRPGLLIPLVRE